VGNFPTSPQVVAHRLDGMVIDVRHSRHLPARFFWGGLEQFADQLALLRRG
jgi:hypothetical protein